MAKSSLCYVAVDSKAETLLAMKYLFDKGHRNIALIGDARQSNSTRIKVATYTEFMESHNLQPCVYMDCNQTHSLIDSGYFETKRMLSEKKNITAVFSIKDDVAIGVIKALKAENKMVPTDISVIGCDGSIVSGNPLIELTTVGWNTEEVSEKIVKLITSQFSKLTEPYLAKPYLIERKSCGDARKKK